VVSNHHWMLCTLLIINAAALESLPIVLEELMSPTVAIIVSVIVVLVFCEIIPMSFCTGPNQLKIAEWCCPIVRLCMYATGILSWPIGKLMDCAVGHGGQQKFENFEMRYLIKKHVDQTLDKTTEMTSLNSSKSDLAPVDSWVD
jgi:metal transporter CNNM